MPSEAAKAFISQILDNNKDFVRQIPLYGCILAVFSAFWVVALYVFAPVFFASAHPFIIGCASLSLSVFWLIALLIPLLGIACNAGIANVFSFAGAFSLRFVLWQGYAFGAAYIVRASFALLLLLVAVAYILFRLYMLLPVLMAHIQIVGQKLTHFLRVLVVWAGFLWRVLRKILCLLRCFLLP